MLGEADKQEILQQMFRNSRSQIVFRKDIFRKMTLGAPVIYNVYSLTYDYSSPKTQGGKKIAEKNFHSLYFSQITLSTSYGPGGLRLSLQGVYYCLEKISVSTLRDFSVFFVFI